MEKLDNIIGRRIRAARLREERRRGQEYSQRQLGFDAGFGPDSNGSRMNHYEQGRHVPPFGTICILAEVLHVPTAYFYTTEDDLAELILSYSDLSARNKQKVVKLAASLMRSNPK